MGSDIPTERLNTESGAILDAESGFNQKRPFRNAVIGCLCFTLVLILAFIKPLIALATLSAKSDVLSYILLIPFVSAYLIYIRKQGLPRIYESSFGLGIGAALLGMAALAAPWIFWGTGTSLLRDAGLAFVTTAFVSFLAAGGFVFLGKAWMQAAAFPVAFLCFMIPLPESVIHALETASQLASAEAAALLFAVSETPFVRDGNVFQLPGITIEVAQECSGIRSSVVLMITSLLAANMFLGSPWHRLILVAAVVPLAIVRNGFRIVVIGLLCVHQGPHMIDSIVHRRGGPVFFALSLIPLFLLLWWLRRVENRRRRLVETPNSARAGV